MKQLMLLFIFVLVLCTYSISVMAFGVDLQMCGDCNGDRRIDNADVLKIQRIASGVDPVPTSPQFEFCNVQGTKGGLQTPGATVDILDAQEIDSAITGGTTGNLDCSLKKEIIFGSVDFGLLTANIHKAQLDGSGEIDITPVASGLSPIHSGVFPAYGYFYPRFFGPDRKIVFVYEDSVTVPGIPKYGIGVMNSDGSNAVSVLPPKFTSTRNAIDGSSDGTKIIRWGMYELDISSGVEKRVIGRGGEDPRYFSDSLLSTGIIPLAPGTSTCVPGVCKTIPSPPGTPAVNGTVPPTITICLPRICTPIPKSAYPHPVCGIGSNGTIPCLTKRVNKILFSSVRDIYTINVDGTDEQKLTASTSGTNIWPSLSSDNTKITFTRLRPNREDIYTMNANGRGQTLITTTPGNWQFPGYTSNNELILIGFTFPITSDIVATNAVTGSRMRQVIINQLNPSYAASVG